MWLRKKFYTHNIRRAFVWLLVSGGVVILVCAGIIAWHQVHTASGNTGQPAHEISSDNPTIRPSTERPTPNAFDTYTVASDLPRYLFIPKLSVKAMVKHLGLTSENQIDAPKNVFDVGWYTGSAKPGHAGALLIDGHVSSDSVQGVFYGLKDLHKDDMITMEKGDGSQVQYRVVKTQVFDANNVDMAAALSPVSAKPGLNLITCTGKVIKGTRNYDKRLVVFSEQL